VRLADYNQPSELSNLNFSELKSFSQELRRYIIDTVLEVGGHFAANLGVIELTVCLIKHFDPNHHPVVWDVGHQSYPYKILTNRKAQLPSIRQIDGLSGFPKIEESPLDYFGTGHSSTSISAMMGLATANLLKGNTSTHIAVIGDGALSGGMSLEALNNLSDTKINALIIFNDNGMGIDPNGGAIHKQSETGIAQFFDFFGLDYQGPIDGHDIEKLESALIEQKGKTGVRLLHIKTVKGKGYKPAEEEQIKWHSAPKFVKIQTQKNSKSWHHEFGDIILKKAKEDEDILGITPAMPTSSGMIRAMEKFPDRFIDVNIAEQHALTFAAGIAASGKKPIVGIYSTFLQRAYDQLIHDIALQNLGVTLCIDRAGLVGEDGPTHHGVFDIPMILSVPNFTLYAPCTISELNFAIDRSLENNTPSAIRYPKGAVPTLELVPDEYQWLNTHPGANVLLITTGKATELAVNGYPDNSNVFDHLHVLKIKPWPEIKLTKQYTHVITVEDGQIQGGFGQYACAQLKTNGATQHLGIEDHFVVHGKNSELYEVCGFSSQAICKLLRELIT